MSSATLVVSVAAHAFTFLALGWFPPPADMLAKSDIVEVTMIEEPAPPEPEPEIAAEPEPAPEPEPETVKPPPKPVAAIAPKEPPPPDTKEPPAAAPETLADFSGTTLVGEGEGGWTSAVGSGAAMDKPIGKAGAVVTGRSREGVAGGVVGGTGLKIVAAADLSRKPGILSQQALDDALVRCYPKNAKQQGIEGVARTRIRILANGSNVVLSAVDETYPGFEAACRCAIKGQVFQPPLDRNGNPVATEMSFKCEFAVY